MKPLRRDDRRQVLRDVILWALLAISVTAMGPDPLRDLGAFTAVTVPRLALTALVVLVGRPWPLAAVVLLLPLMPWDFADALATSDVSWLHPAATGVKIIPFGPVSPFSIWYAYLAGRRDPRPHRRILPASIPAPALVGAAITSIGVVLVIVRDGSIGLWITMISGLIGTYLVPYLLGLLRRRLLHQRDQTRQAAETQARLRERARIARDMHDSLGHELALIAVRAAGLELSPTLAPAHAKAAGDLRAATADAIDRLHQIIGVLREDPTPPTQTHPTPTPPNDTSAPTPPALEGGGSVPVLLVSEGGGSASPPPAPANDGSVPVLLVSEGGGSASPPPAPANDGSAPVSPVPEGGGSGLVLPVAEGGGSVPVSPVSESDGSALASPVPGNDSTSAPPSPRGEDSASAPSGPGGEESTPASVASVQEDGRAELLLPADGGVPRSRGGEGGGVPRTRGRGGSLSAGVEVVGLVERARDSGMAVTLRLEGPVPALAHAVVQEGLTNAAKHAPGAAVEVTVTPRRVVVRNGLPARPPLGATTGGFGLAGLRERAHLAGGTLRAAPADGGFELAAELP